MNTHSMLFILFGAATITLETYVWAWRNGQTGKPRARFLALRQESIDPNLPAPRHRPVVLAWVIVGLLGITGIWAYAMAGIFKAAFGK